MIMKVVDREMDYIHKIKDKEQGIEDERKSGELFLKLSLQDLNLAIFTFICNLFLI